MKPTTLSAEEIDDLRASYDVIPIVREFSADAITPVTAFEALAASGDEAFLLESVERGESVGRYSFVGTSPRRRLAFTAGDNPVDELRHELQPLRVFAEESLPPFFGGAVGYFAYGAAHWTERIGSGEQTSDVPSAALLFFDNVVAFDHLRQTLIIVSNIFASDPEDSSLLLDRAVAALNRSFELLANASPQILPIGGEDDLQFRPSTSRDEFVDRVRRAREEIAAGEAFQVVLSQRWEADFPEDQALALYRALRRLNPSPYMFLLRTAECTLVGASPEVLARSRGGVAELRPIAGTRPRGSCVESDRLLVEELRADPKENAEHLMLVDLARNDLARVCTTGSVSVVRFCAVEKYSHVMHLVSSVDGTLRDDSSALDLLLASFPAGTVSGAPKIRAMEIIESLESEQRGVYAGAVAYFGFSGSLDSCIAIRTIVLRGGRAVVQAGAGIVFDSDPEREYEETRHKAAASMQALRTAAGSFKAGAVLSEAAR